MTALLLLPRRAVRTAPPAFDEVVERAAVPEVTSQ
jgi:hypothetical protein